jgi:predicted GIY-YIG superfamily endonuclease
VFWVYILLCSDGSYYTGHTDNLEARLGAHGDGAMGGYTLTLRPVRLVWSEYLGTRDEALGAESQIKRWSRAKKEALIQGDWDLISLLARNKRERSR